MKTQAASKRRMVVAVLKVVKNKESVYGETISPIIQKIFGNLEDKAEPSVIKKMKNQKKGMNEF